MPIKHKSASTEPRARITNLRSSTIAEDGAHGAGVASRRGTEGNSRGRENRGRCQAGKKSGHDAGENGSRRASEVDVEHSNRTSMERLRNKKKAVVRGATYEGYTPSCSEHECGTSCGRGTHRPNTKLNLGLGGSNERTDANGPARADSAPSLRKPNRSKRTPSIEPVRQCAIDEKPEVR